MAAKKKKQKRASAKKAVAANLVVGSKVKDAVKSTGYRCSGDLVDALNAHVAGVIGAAVKRCAANNRGTVRPQDL